MTATAIDHVRSDLLRSLRSTVRGPVLVPDDDGYDMARAAWNRNAEHRPAVVVQAADAYHVGHAVRAARTVGVGVGVLATGHGTGQPCHGGLLVNTSRMRGVEVDPAARQATTTDAVSTLTGRSARSFADFARTYADAFRSNRAVPLGV